MRFAVGAGVEPELHSAAEERFGFPLIELWGMTEMVRVLADSIEPRHVGTRAFGRAIDGVEARVVDDDGRECRRPSPAKCSSAIGGNAAARLLFRLSQG